MGENVFSIYIQIPDFLELTAFFISFALTKCLISQYSYKNDFKVSINKKKIYSSWNDFYISNIGRTQAFTLTTKY